MKKNDVIFGIHAVMSVLEHEPERVLEIWITPTSKQRLDKILELAADIGITVQTAKNLDTKAQSDKHQGVVARVKPLKVLAEPELEVLLDTVNNPLFLILDGVTDPHNLGACMRSADACGVVGIIVPKDNSAGISGVVNKVACGAAQNVPLFQVTNLARTMKRLKELGVWIVGTAGDCSQNIYQVDLKGPLAIAMGAEDTGLRRLTKETCDTLAYIPMLGSVSSLNVSVATGVCLYEAIRQRL